MTHTNHCSKCGQENLSQEYYRFTCKFCGRKHTSEDGTEGIRGSLTPDQIEQMARDAGFAVMPDGIFNPDTFDEKPLDVYLTRFAQAVRAAALEEAATVSETVRLVCPSVTGQRVVTATAIRSLAQQAGGEHGGEK